MTQETTVTVRTWGYHEDCVGYPPHSLEDAIRQFQETLLEVPKEYRASAEVDFSPSYEFGDSYEQVRITYSRPETPEETTTREASERAGAIAWIEEQEALIRRRKLEYNI